MRKTIMSLILLMAVFVVPTVLTAAEAAVTTPAGRSAGQVIDDATITAQVKAKLLNDNITRGLAVSVKTFEGEVTLTGAVDTDQQRMKAVDIASAVAGVKKVNDLITLKNSG